MPDTVSSRQRRSRLFVVAFVVLMIALSVFATIMIQSGREDAAFQEELDTLREQGR